MKLLKNEYVHSCIAHPVGFFLQVCGFKEQQEKILNATRPEKREQFIQTIEEIQKKITEMLVVIDTCLDSLNETSGDIVEVLEEDNNG